MKKHRLDQLVFECGLTESRERAKTTIMSGLIYVNGQKVDKPGMQFPEDCEIELRGKTLPFVSRGGYKLDKAFKVFDIDACGKVCMDCGASTGGFTDVLLQHGAQKVYSVDVGYGQLAWKLRNDSRVINIERCNLRYISEKEISEKIDMAVMDVSFISVKLVIPAVHRLLKEDADYVILIKPQFEAGRDEVGKKGVIRDSEIHGQVLHSVLDFARDEGFSVMGLDYSPIKGPEGNIEYICHLKNGSFKQTELNVEAIVAASHEKL